MLVIRSYEFGKSQSTLTVPPKSYPAAVPFIYNRDFVLNTTRGDAARMLRLFRSAVTGRRIQYLP